jgi:hypothetical protein
MAEYTVEIWERIKHVVQVDAESETEAYDMALSEIQDTDVDYVYDREFTSEVEIEEASNE